jgi:ABC-type Fe2+-enterobactin transport system substrate-binding protein
MKIKMYIIEYSTGSWDSWNKHNVFVTENEEVAKQYIEKFNHILTKWKTYLEEILEKNPNKINDNDFYERYIKFNEANKAYYTEIQIR